MINFDNLKNSLSWHLIRPHLCTLAVALSFSNTWRAPREAFRYGGLTSTVVTTVAVVMVALPVTLMQLSVGQLSQQDAVGIWRAVPFFKGVGYIRLLISFIAAGYSVVYIVMSLSFIAYISSNNISVWECTEPTETPVGDVNFVRNTSACLNVSFLMPVGSQPEYYVAMAFIMTALWILFPFILYNPVKLMKRIFYAFGFLVLLLGIIVASCIGTREDIAWFADRRDWVNFVRPHIWYSALVKALVSNQIAGGYLISSGDSIYANTNVQWTALIFVGANILGGWVGVLFWFAVSGDGDKITNNLAVLLQIYKVTGDKDLEIVWPLLTFIMLSISGFITVVKMSHIYMYIV